MTQVPQKPTPTPKKVTKGFGAFLIALSGLVLYLDKLFKMFNIELVNLHNYNNTSAYIWSLMQTISPLLIIVGFLFWIDEKQLRFYLLVILVPLFCYFLQFFYVQSSMSAEDPITWLYIVGSSSLLLVIIYWIKKKLLFLDKALNLKMEMLEKYVESTRKEKESRNE